MASPKRITNSLIIKTIKGQKSLEESEVQLPQIRTNEAVVSVSHIGQNTVDGASTAVRSEFGADNRSGIAGRRHFMRRNRAGLRLCRHRREHWQRSIQAARG